MKANKIIIFIITIASLLVLFISIMSFILLEQIISTRAHTIDKLIDSKCVCEYCIDAEE